VRCQPLFRASRLLGRWWARAPVAPLGGCGAARPWRAAGDGAEDSLAPLGHDRKRTEVLRHLPEHRYEGHGIERRARGGDASEGQAAR
jgi:hypothetical protein